jgi:hypothetical protein
VSISDDRDKFRRAELRVRHLLFGDGMFESGRLKGEEARDDVTHALRRMREAFDAVLARSEENNERKAEVEARIADLEEELTRIARSTARGERSVGTPKKVGKRTPKRSH